MKQFVCYAAEDRELVDKYIVRPLISAGEQPWVEYNLLTGQNRKEEALKELKLSDAFIYALTPASVQSKQCQREFAEAQRQKKPIMPVLLKSCDLPHGLENIHPLDFTNSPSKDGISPLLGGLRRVAFQAQEPPSQPVPLEKSYLPDILINIVAAAIYGILVPILTKLFQPILPTNAFPIIEIIVAFLVLGGVATILILRDRRWTRTRILLSLVTPVGIFIAVLVISPLLRQSTTIYFIADMSDNVRGISADILPRLIVKANTVAAKDEVGFAVFGGGQGDKSGCEDTAVLVPPAPKDDSVQTIETVVEYLEKLPAYGMGGLQNAILTTMHALAGRQNPIKIVVFTTHFDYRCDMLDRNAITKLADELGLRYQIEIVTVGAMSEQDEILFKSYAHVYHNAPTVADLPPIVAEIIQSQPMPYGPYDNR